MSNSIVLEKLRILNTVLAELRSLGQINIAQLDHDWLVRRAVERNVLVLSRMMSEVCQRVVHLAEQATEPGSVQSAVAYCVQVGALSQNEAYDQIERFWQFVYHQYEHVDAAILVDAVNKRLDDFEQFHNEIMEYVHRNWAGEPPLTDEDVDESDLFGTPSPAC
ncbi:MAG: HepT-like ribonuclease domain-containing protein [Caldilineaceae bacterium]